MADRTSGGKSSREVIGIVGACVIRLVAGIAVGRQSCEVIVFVTGCAWHCDVCAGQRERGLVVVEGRCGPGRGVVASGAGGGEPGSNMIRICGSFNSLTAFQQL